MIVLVLGGTRSGKSTVAERIASRLPQPVTYVATASVGRDDDDFAARVAKHRERRPTAWRTLEEPDDLAGCIGATDGTVLVDSIGTWIAGGHEFARDVDGLCHVCVERDGDTVLVGEEVGLSVHPPTEVGRRFADALGECNRRIADVADRVLLVVAGRALELGSVDA
ncbi:MAG TPA: bifunctional adenosylcobinamide kinase/adenosylcobinamide-phosphate guanylyltransferase [Acidimicrobiia bacterium]|jgi:adenosylcobinamide kinase/adenosylcobinamide-phosphate guanylyltransferase